MSRSWRTKALRFTLLLVTTLCCSQVSRAQNDIENVLTDLLFITRGYIQPAAEASLFQSSTGWVDRAAVLPRGEYRIAAHANALFIPQGEQSYVVRNDQLRNARLRDTDVAVIPTALGGDTNQFLDFEILGEQFELQAFEGVKIDVLPHVYLQGAVGLGYNSQLTLRYAPSVPFGKSSYGILGAGLQHEFTSYLGDLPFRVSGAISYATFNLDLQFDAFTFESTTTGFTIFSADAAVIDASSWTYQLAVSKQLGRHNVWGAMVYTHGQIEYSLDGPENLFLTTLNRVIDLLDETQRAGKVDVGYTYQSDHWRITSTLSSGQFINLHLGVGYRL